MQRSIAATVTDMENTTPHTVTGGINFFVRDSQPRLEFNSADPLASYGRDPGDETRGSLMQDFLTVQKICSCEVLFQFYSLHLKKLFRRIHNLHHPPTPPPARFNVVSFLC